MSKLNNHIIEEITYHLRSKSYNADEIIYKIGDPVTNMHFITRGEVELFYPVNSNEIVIHNLYQG